MQYSFRIVKIGVAICAIVLFSSLLYGQHAAQQNLIAASQAGASPLYFYPDAFAWPVIQPSGFNNPAECKVRDGLPNFLSKLKSDKTVTIGYLGGSITRADNQYRVQSAKFIQSLFPRTKIAGINAGVSGTGTDLGACRLHDQLLKYNPDLVFVEFAVNGAFAEGMEGIIRQIWKFNPTIDICLIYTITDGLGKIYADGNVPQHIAKLEQLADHYAIPSIHLGIEAAFLEKQEKLLWKGDPELVKDKIIFSADGVHPLEAGGNLYAGAIARAVLQLKKNTKSVVHRIPKPLLPDNWENAKMMDPLQIASFSADWEKINPSGNTGLNKFSEWFPYLMKAEKPGASFSFWFEGTLFGIFDIGGPEVGQLEIELDGTKVNLKQLSAENYQVTTEPSLLKFISRFNRFCNNRYRGQCAYIKVNPGKHLVKMSIAEVIPDKTRILGENQLTDITSHPEKYNRTVAYLGKILIRGALLKTNN